MKMLTTTFNVVKLYIYIYVCVSINIDIFKEENPNNFHLKYIHTFCYKDTKDGEGKKRKRNLSQFCNFAFSRRSDFIFQTKFFSHGEWSSTHAKSSFRRNWKKSGAYHYLFSPRFSSLHLWGWTIVFEELSTLTSTLATLNMVENTRYQSRITESRFIPVLSDRFETNDFDDERKR